MATTKPQQPILWIVGNLIGIDRLLDVNCQSKIRSTKRLWKPAPK